MDIADGGEVRVNSCLLDQLASLKPGNLYLDL